MRTYKVERIQSATLTQDRYEIPADFDPDAWLANSWGIWSSDSTPAVRVRLRFESSVAHRVREAVWHRSQELTELPKGRLELAVTVERHRRDSALDHVVGWRGRGARARGAAQGRCELGAPGCGALCGLRSRPSSSPTTPPHARTHDERGARLGAPPDARRVAVPRRGARGLRLCRLGRRTLGRAIPAGTPPDRHRRDRRSGAACPARRLAAAYPDRPARHRAGARLRDRDRVCDEPRHEPASDRRHRRIRRDAVRGADLHPVSAVMGRSRHRGAGARPVGSDPRQPGGPPHRMGARGSSGHSAHPAARGGHAVRLSGRAAVRDLARMGACRPHRVAPLAAHRAGRSGPGRCAAHRAVRVALGVAGDGRHDPRGRHPLGLAAEASSAAVGQPGRTDDRPRGPGAGRARGGNRPRRTSPDRGHLADLSRQPLARHPQGLEHRSAARHRPGLHAVRATGRGAGLHVPRSPAALAQPAARRARRCRAPRPGSGRGARRCHRLVRRARGGRGRRPGGWRPIC